MHKPYSRNSLLLLIFTACFLMAFAPLKIKWEVLSPPEGKFKMKFPGTPKTETSELEGGQLYKYSAEVEGNTYFASFILHNETLTDHEELAQTSVDAFGKNIKGEKKNQIVWMVKKDKGLMATYELEEPKIRIEYRAVLIGQHQYQLVVFGDQDQFPREDADKFFKSFKRLK